LSETGYVIFLLLGIIIVVAAGVPLMYGVLKKGRKGKKT
jgi:uncharacterized membrane protein SpoIIM required for sporulation